MSRVNEESTQSQYRFYVLGVSGLLLIAALILTAFRGGVYTLSGTPIADSVKVEFPVPGTTLIKVNDQPHKASYLLAASDLWADTGLILQPHQSIAIVASGRANLAFHCLVAAARNDVFPCHGWVGPAGGSGQGATGKESCRARLRIVPKAGYGALLAYLHKKGDPPPGKENSRPSPINVIGESGSITNDSDVPRSLWLVINDAVLFPNDEASKLAYLEVENMADTKINRRPSKFKSYDKDVPESWTILEHWRYIETHQYWNVWFDDNVGFYQIQIDYQPGLAQK